MRKTGSGSGRSKRALTLAFPAFALTLGSHAQADEPPSTPVLAQAPGPSALLPPAPALPAATVPAPTTDLSAREAQLEARVRQLEIMVQSLSAQLNQRPAATSGTGALLANAAAKPAPTNEVAGSAPPDVPSAASAVAPSRSGGVGAPGQSMPPNPPPSSRFNSPATLESKRSTVKFGPGFEIRSDDDEYIMQFHNLTQFDYRGYQQGGQTSVHDTFAFPRQWFMFSGRLTKPFGYFVSFANGFDTFSILDVFLDIEYDPRLRFRIGRFKTPFTYEFFAEPVQGLVTPERSVFFNNFGLNRDLGLMAYGRLLSSKVDYAAGLFNGARSQLLAVDNSKDVAAFLNYRPFSDRENSLFENMNIGGSVYSGNQDHTPIPQTFRTVVPITGNAVIGVPFLGLNDNVVNSGFETFWDMHLAWFYRQLEVIGEWGSGFETYALDNTPQFRTRVPVQSFYVQASYLITGETRSSIGIVKPNRPFDIRHGKWGPGALEPFVRYEYLDVSNRVFTNGLADPNLWANRLFSTHLGIDWHLTQYIKMYFDWHHSEFNQPVVFAPGRRQPTSDTFWVRWQIFF